MELLQKAKRFDQPLTRIAKMLVTRQVRDLTTLYCAFKMLASHVHFETRFASETITYIHFVKLPAR